VSLAEHLVPEDDFVDLAMGRGAPAAIGRLAAGQRSLRAAALLFTARRSRPAAAAVEVISQVQRAAPAVGEALIAHPFLGSWAAQRAGPQTDADYLVGLALGGALGAGLDVDLVTNLSSGRLVLPGRGLVPVDPADAVTVRTRSGELVVGQAGRSRALPPVGGADWDMLRRAEAPFAVVIEDLDPYRNCFGHPAEKRLSPAAADRVRMLIGQAWAYLTAALPERAPTVAATVTTLVPLADPGQGGTSASSRRAFAAVGLHVPDDPRLLALLLVHEHMHIKLNALVDLVPLVNLGGEARYVAGWRPDLRSAAALLHGAYAHCAVTDFWRAAARLEPDWRLARDEADRWAAHTATALHTLALSGELTARGESFVGILRGALDA
jgi:uncharacterized protein